MVGQLLVLVSHHMT